MEAIKVIKIVYCKKDNVKLYQTLEIKMQKMY